MWLFYSISLDIDEEIDGENCQYATIDFIDSSIKIATSDNDVNCPYKLNIARDINQDTLHSSVSNTMNGVVYALLGFCLLLIITSFLWYTRKAKKTSDLPEMTKILKFFIHLLSNLIIAIFTKNKNFNKHVEIKK